MKAKRRDIQALRALAVLSVVVAHVWPTGPAAGGFVGVDVFFVISGYLITGHLVRELDTRGRISILAFYTRRIRRLLPAALAVLVASSLAASWYTTGGVRRAELLGIIASALNVQNLWLARESVDYFTLDTLAVSTQHFWSLAVEEQFYLVWPPLLLLGLWIQHRLPPGGRHAHLTTARTGLLSIITLVLLVSLLCGMIWTTLAPGSAYFVTPTRMWELAAGGLLALIRQPYWGRVGAAAMRTGGFVAIGLAIVAFSETTPFPGFAAMLPVAGTLAVIAAGDVSALDRGPVARVILAPSTQWFGDISYSLYLWHWPILVFALHATGSVSFGERLAIIGCSVACAAISYRFIERAFDYAPRDTPARSIFTIAATATVVVLLAATVALGAWSGRPPEVLSSARASSGVPVECLGAAAIVNRDACPNALDSDGVRINLLPQDAPWPQDDPRCDDAPGKPGDYETFTCMLGKNDDAPRIAIIGDSHAMHLSAAIIPLAEERGWNLLFANKSHCTPTAAALSITWDTHFPADQCSSWTAAITDYVAAWGADAAVLSSFSSVLRAEDGGPFDRGASRQALDAMLGDVPLVVVQDNPHRRDEGKGTETLDACLHRVKPAERNTACSITPDGFTAGTDHLVEMFATDDRARIVHTRDIYCPDGTCYPIIGGQRVYVDQHHISHGFAATLRPLIEEPLSHAVSAGLEQREQSAR